MTLLAGNLSPNHRLHGAEYRQRGYLANGWNLMRRWDGRTATLETAGIAGPSLADGSWAPVPTTAVGAMTVGVHVFRYRYEDSRTGYVSDPSVRVEVEVVAGAERLTFPIAAAPAATDKIVRSTDSKVDTIVLEATPVGGTGDADDEFFVVARALNSASSIVADLEDSELETQFLPWPPDGHYPPPLTQFVLSHRDRLWLYGQVSHAVGTASFTTGLNLVPAGSTNPDWTTEAFGAASGESRTTWFIRRADEDRAYQVDFYDAGNARLVLKENFAGISGTDVAYVVFSRSNVIWASTPGYPEGFVQLGFVNGPNGERAGDLTAAIGYLGGVQFFTESTTFKLLFDSDPRVDSVILPVSSERGALSPRVVVNVEGVVYSMDKFGWTAWQGVVPRHLSKSVDAILDEVDFDLADRFHACWLPSTRAIRWWVCFEGEDYPKHYVQLDVDTGAWSQGEYLQGISESRLVKAPGGRGLRVALGDENGHVWYADQGTCDGVPAFLSHPTADGGATTTAVSTTGVVLPTDGVGVRGAFLHRRDGAGGGESRLVVDNTFNLLTVDPPFSQAPAQGDVLWLGPIPAKLRSRTYLARSTAFKQRTGYLTLWLKPSTGARLLQVRVYEDLSAVAKAWDAFRGTVLPGGLTWPGEDVDYPASDWLLDVSQAPAQVRAPIGSEWRYAFAVELEVLEPDADFMLLGVEHDGEILEEAP